MWWKVRTTVILPAGMTNELKEDNHWAMDAELGVHGPFILERND